MVIHKILDAKRFIACHGFASDNEKIVAPNTFSGGFGQIMYIMTGSATISPTDPNSPIKPKTFQVGINDITEYYGTPCTYTAGPNGGTWICINPIPMNARYKMTELVDGQVITGDLTERTIMCFAGTIKANDKELQNMNYARIFNGKTVTVSVPPSATAVLLERIQSANVEILPENPPKTVPLLYQDVSTREL
jgi:hypothetical protein